MNQPGPEPACGDGACNGSETCATCFADCPDSPCCGNGILDGSEVCEAGQQHALGGPIYCNSTCNGYEITECVAQIVDGSNYTLRDNLSFNLGTCILIGEFGSNATLDCGGKTINGSFAPLTTAIEISGANNVTVKNCTAVNSNYGIIISNSSGGEIANNNLNDNVYGISLFGLSTTFNNVHDNTIDTGAGTYGIYLGDNSNLRAYLSSPVALHVIIPHARCSMAR